MSVKAIHEETKRKMDKALDAFQHELSVLRTGRASIAILEGVKVDYYGTLTPISQIATLNCPDTRTITAQPWDISQIPQIEKAILSSDLGLTPTTDGKVIRILIPLLTEERRKELVKIAKKYAEESKIVIRNLRRDANEYFKKLEKEKTISQDEVKKSQEHVQKVTDAEIKRIDEILAKKEGEIMEV